MLRLVSSVFYLSVLTQTPKFFTTLRTTVYAYVHVFTHSGDAFKSLAMV